MCVVREGIAGPSGRPDIVFLHTGGSSGVVLHSPDVDDKIVPTNEALNALERTAPDVDADYVSIVEACDYAAAHLTI
jgi:hypothetical protein